jgi:hypothetical protein
MTADLLITALVIERDRAPDFEAARKAICSVDSRHVEIPDEFWEHDVETDDGIDANREALWEALNELEAALRCSREFGWLQVRGADVYVTGGLSSGDSPGQLFEAFSELLAVPAVLSAAGFEVEMQTPSNVP